MFQETSYEVKKYMYTAKLDNGVTIIAYEDGTADGFDGNRYRLISHFNEEEEVVVDGWEQIN